MIILCKNKDCGKRTFIKDGECYSCRERPKDRPKSPMEEYVSQVNAITPLEAKKRYQEATRRIIEGDASAQMEKNRMWAILNKVKVE